MLIVLQTFKCPVCSKDFELQVGLKSHIRTDHPNLKLLEDMEQPTLKMEDSLEMSHSLSEDMNQHQESLEHHQLQQASLEQALQHTHDPQDSLNQQVLQAQAMEVSSEVHSQAGLNAQPQTTYILPPGVTILTDNQVSSNFAID